MKRKLKNFWKENKRDLVDFFWTACLFACMFVTTQVYLLLG